MKLIYPDIDNLFEFKNNYVNTIVIENKVLFFDLVSDLINQINGYDGKTILSVDNAPIAISKNLEIFIDYINLDVNKKTLITKVINQLEKIAVNAENYEKTQKLLSEIEQYMENISFEIQCDIDYTKINIDNILKSIGITIRDDYEGNVGILEKLLDYMELVREFEKDKLFVFVNLRSYVNDNLLLQFFKTICEHEYKILLIENKSYDIIEYEKRITIDEDLCLF